MDTFHLEDAQMLMLMGTRISFLVALPIAQSPDGKSAPV